MPYIWFWTFWHWTTENYRAGSLLRSPIHGIGGHWDEWFRFEASPEERHAIENAGRNARAQRQFVSWLVSHWAPEAQWRGSHAPPRFVLTQLATLSPFDRWPAFSRYRTGFGVGGVAAVVLAEESLGESADVRVVEALTLPSEADAAASTLVAEGFRADPTELRTTRDAAMSLLRGKALLRFLAVWVATGRRPYSRAIAAALALGWISVGLLIVWLVAGPEPGERLVLTSVALTALWVTLVCTAVTVVVRAGIQAWRFGREMGISLERSQVRLRMDGGLSLIGGSAGLAFCVNTLLSVYRATPHDRLYSWVWNRVFRRLHSEMRSWAATGVITADGRIRPVVLEPKLRACARHPRITNMLTPNQREASDRSASRVVDARRATTNEVPISEESRTGAALASQPRTIVAFATEARAVRSHRCRHLAHAILTIGDLGSRRQVAVNALAFAASAVMIAALGDLRGILLPPSAPLVVGPVSQSPYQLWVNLDTRQPDAFSVVLESGFWANRRANLMPQTGLNAPARAELRLSRVSGQLSREIEDGTVWVERRRKFLTREFAPGERVGRYSLTYLTRLHD